MDSMEPIKPMLTARLNEQLKKEKRGTEKAVSQQTYLEREKSGGSRAKSLSSRSSQFTSTLGNNNGFFLDASSAVQ